MRKSRIFVVWLLLIISACSFERDGGYARQFGLEAAYTPEATYRKTQNTLKVKYPVMAPELDTDRIALRQPDGRRDYFANAKWADFLPGLIQSAVVQSFAQSGRYRSVIADDSATATGYALDTRVEAFQIELASGSVPASAYIRLRMTLHPYGSSRVLGEAVLEDRRIVRSTHIRDMMAGLSGLFVELQNRAIARLGAR